MNPSDTQRLGENPPPATPVDGLSKVASTIAAACMFFVFALFVYGIAMRYLVNRPQSWVDEAVTLLSVWCTFWTAACVLKWPDFIAFDVLFNRLRPEHQRWVLLGAALLFIGLIGAALPGMVDYTLFLWRERTDALQLRMDLVFSIFPFFFAVVLLRMCAVAWRLIGAGWRAELQHWAGGGAA